MNAGEAAVAVFPAAGETVTSVPTAFPPLEQPLAPGSGPQTQKPTIPVGGLPISVTVNPPTGDVYVTNFNDGTVSVISGRTNTVTTTIPVGNGPVGVAVNPPTGAVYVTNIGDDTVSVISG